MRDPENMDHRLKLADIPELHVALRRKRKLEQRNDERDRGTDEPDESVSTSCSPNGQRASFTAT
jgi:hypothetical protein